MGQVSRGCPPQEDGRRKRTVLSGWSGHPAMQTRVTATHPSVLRGQAALRNKASCPARLPPPRPSRSLQPWLSGCRSQEADGRKALVSSARKALLNRNDCTRVAARQETPSAGAVSAHRGEAERPPGRSSGKLQIQAKSRVSLQLGGRHPSA